MTTIQRQVFAASVSLDCPLVDSKGKAINIEIFLGRPARTHYTSCKSSDSFQGEVGLDVGSSLAGLIDLSPPYLYHCAERIN